MKAIICLLFIPAGLAVWILGSPQTAWRVYRAFRRTGPNAAPPTGVGNTMLRVGATLALFSLVVIAILLTRAAD